MSTIKDKHDTFHPRCEAVETIRRSPLPQKELAQAYGVSRPTMTRIINGTTWRDNNG